MALTLDFSSLTTYTDQIQMPIIRAAVLPSTLMEVGINYQENVTNVTSLNIMNSTLTVKTGGNCAAFSGTGSTTLSQRNISVCPLLVEEEHCPDKFKEYWTKQITKAGSYDEAGPDEFNRIYTAYKLDQVSAFVEDLFWCGTTTGTASSGFYNANLTQCNGILHNLVLTSASASTVRVGSTFSGALTTANALNIFDQFVANIPNDILGEPDLTLFMSHSNFITFCQALRIANYFNYGADMNQGGQWMIKNALGTTVNVVAMRGLKYTNRMILTNASNLYLGTDLRNDYEKFRTWYSYDNNTVRNQIKWRMGTQVAFPQNVVVYNA